MVDMQEHWLQMDEIVAMTPMPHEYRDFVVKILCADCHEASSCTFHVVGLKCGACGSYNTTRTGQETAPDAPVSEAAVTSEAAAAAATREGSDAQEPAGDGASGEHGQ